MEISKYEKYKTLDTLPIATKVCFPEITAVRKGVIQIVHDMCEVKDRYERVIKFFTEKGYICVISDLRGHGENVEFDKDLGYFGDDGANLLIEDIHAVTIFIKNNFPDLPITLLGQGMGSLIARAYTKKYDEDIEALVLTGSPSMKKYRWLECWAVELLTVFLDEHHVNKYVDKYMFDGYRKKFQNEGIKNSWLCSDSKEVEEYNKNPRCGFMLTLNGFKTLCKLQNMVYSERGWQVNNKGLRILYLSGEEDASLIDIESFKRSVSIMKKIGYTNVDTKLYKKMRHEILKEPGYIKVCKEILKNLPVA